jgi:pyridoxine 5-phosphate synthase
MNPLIAGGSADPRGTTALSVNLNKVALLRNTRTLGIPSVTRAGRLALEAGAHGLTVHPRPDERHIRPHDVFELAALLRDWPQAEFNVEGNPLHNLMPLARDLRARGLPLHQLTFVPDSVDQSTSDHGWRFPQDTERLAPLVAEARGLGVRVSLFMDPTPGAMAAARAVGADRIELYTETYARAHGTPEAPAVLAGFRAAGEAAVLAGLEVNAGHDLNRANLTDFLVAVPWVREVSIGHALLADALELGLAETVRDYLRCLHRAGR